MDLASGTRSSQVSLWNLPEELLLCIMKSLHIKDILNMRAVNPIFRDMIDDFSAVWKAASFQDTWPSPKNAHYFEKAAKFGNMEALIKMAIAYLPINANTLGITLEEEDGMSDVNKAAEMVCQIEAMTPFESFTWLYLRPFYHWEIFTKYEVMIHLENHIQKSNTLDAKNLNVCVAKSLLMMSADESVENLPLHEKKADAFLSNARQLGSECAAFLLWQMEYRSILSLDGVRKLESMRQLREIARMGHLDSKLLLCKMYANEMYGGITPKQAAMFVRELAQSTTPANTQGCFKSSQEHIISTRYGVTLGNRFVDIAVKNHAEQLGSACAASLLLQTEYRRILCLDGAEKRKSMRQLREITRIGHLDSKLLQCKIYADGLYGLYGDCITPEQAAMFVRELAQSTTPANTQGCFKSSQEHIISTRYGVVNHMVEIAVKENVSGNTLYTAVSVVDRYLSMCHKTTWNELTLVGVMNKLTLVGVSAMVLCSRFLEKDILDYYIDFAHNPADVVRMMGEITAALKGNIRVPNSLDFMEIFSSVAELDKKCSCLAEYVCELTLLYAEMGQYSPAEIAASSVLLARLLMRLNVPWPDKMVEFSGFTIEDIKCCVSHMYKYCLIQEQMVDLGVEVLQAVKQRYAKEKFHKVSEIPIMSPTDLCYRLGMRTTDILHTFGL